MVEQVLLLQTQRKSKQLEQLISEFASATPEELGSRLQRGGRIGPQIRGVPHGVLVPQRLIGDVDRSVGEGLLEIGWCVDAIGRCVGLFAAADPTSVHIIGRHQLGLLGFGHVEEVGARSSRVGKHCWVDSMVDHDQKAAPSKVGIDGGREFGARRCVAVEPGGEVDERDEVGV